MQHKCVVLDSGGLVNTGALGFVLYLDEAMACPWELVQS
jgi:hypothetical protein